MVREFVDLTEREFVGLYPDSGKCDLSKFVAVPSEEHERWHIAPRVFWQNNGFIPDWCGPEVPGFAECCEHTYEYLGDGDPREAFRSLGIEAVNNPVWGWDR